MWDNTLKILKIYHNLPMNIFTTTTITQNILWLCWKIFIVSYCFYIKTVTYSRFDFRVTIFVFYIPHVSFIADITLLYIRTLFSFTLYSEYSMIGRGNLVLIDHSLFHLIYALVRRQNCSGKTVEKKGDYLKVNPVLQI